MIKKGTLSFVYIAAMLIIFGANAWHFYFKEYKQADTIDIHKFPKTIGDWASEELTITDEEYAILETRNAFARKYQNSQGIEIYLLLVYSQHNRKVSHPPEICYTGSGLSILHKEQVELDILHPYGEGGGSEKLIIGANKLILEQRDLKQLAVYWFKVGDTFTPSYWQQQVSIALKTLANKPASSALIRMSVGINNQSPEGVLSTIEDFTQAITPLLYTYLP